MTRIFLALIILAIPALACEGDPPPGYQFGGVITASNGQIVAIKYEPVPNPSIQIAFSPHSGATEAVVQVIAEAQHSIHLAGYGFTSKPIAQALITDYNRGVEVEAVLDKSNTTHRTEAGELAAAGVLVRIDSRYAIIDAKYIVVDGKTVECGSFNYTTAAEWSNAEDLLILRDDQAVAALYDVNWTKLWSESQPWGQQ